MNEKEKSIAIDVLKSLSLGTYGRDFNPLYPNFAWVKKHVSKEINRALNIGAAQRKQITNQQYEAIEKAGTLNGIRQSALTHFKGKRKEKQRKGK